MKKPQFLTAKSILIALSLATVFAISTALLHAQTGAETNDQWQSEAQSESQAARLEGSWDVSVTPVVPPGVPQPPSFHAYGTFARGGAFIGSDRNRPAGKQHGVWEHLGGNRFAYTAKEDLFDERGIFSGLLSIRVRVMLNGRDEFIGVANGEQRDANGNVVFNRCTTVKATRIKLEPLSEQCQGITPPR